MSVQACLREAKSDGKLPLSAELRRARASGRCLSVWSLLNSLLSLEEKDTKIGNPRLSHSFVVSRFVPLGIVIIGTSNCDWSFIHKPNRTSDTLERR